MPASFSLSSGRSRGCPVCPTPAKGTLEYALMMTRANPGEAKSAFDSWVARFEQFPENLPITRFLRHIAETDIAAAIAVLWWHGDQYRKVTSGGGTG